MRIALIVLCIVATLASTVAACRDGDDDSKDESPVTAAAETRVPPTARPQRSPTATPSVAAGPTQPPATPPAVVPSVTAGPTFVPTSSCYGHCPTSLLTPTPAAVDENGVPRVPPLRALTFSASPELSTADIVARGGGPPGRGAFNVARVQISRIAVDAPVEAQVVGATGVMPEPGSATVVAWYDFSLWPGLGGLPLAGGNAVFAGDLDRFRHGNGVFVRLNEVGAGDIITLVLQDGRRLYYRVEFNKVANRDSADFAAITSATADESATFITAAGERPGAPDDSYSGRRIVWTRRVNCLVQLGALGCDLPR